jgi:hypothetical protein
VWCGAVRCGGVRCGAVRCGAVRCGAVRCGAVRCGAVRCGAVRCDAVSSTVMCVPCLRLCDGSAGPAARGEAVIQQYARMFRNDAALSPTK